MRYHILDEEDSHSKEILTLCRDDRLVEPIYCFRDYVETAKSIHLQDARGRFHTLEPCPLCRENEKFDLYAMRHLL